MLVAPRHTGHALVRRLPRVVLPLAAWLGGGAVAHADLLVSSFDTNEFKRYDGTTGAFPGNLVTAGSGGLDGPMGLAFGPDGNLYVRCADCYDR